MLLYIGTISFVLAVNAFLVCGCGGSGKSTPGLAQTGTSVTSASVSTEPMIPTTPRLNRTALVARADAICKRVVAQRELIASQLRTPQDFAQQIPRFADYERTALAELRSLTPPPSLAAAWRQIAGKATTLAVETGRWSGLVKENRIKMAYSQVYPKVRKLDLQIAHALRNKGFRGCSQF